MPPKGLPAKFLKNHTFSFLDVETTGLSAFYGDRVCEIAVLKWRNGKTIDTFHTLINPQRSISSGAYAVNRITPKMLEGKPFFPEVAPKLLSLLKDTIMVCHNVPFDLGFLIAECERVPIKIPEIKLIDTLLLARRHFNFWSNSLGSVAESLGIDVKKDHRALADVKTTLAVFLHFISYLEKHGIEDINQITCGSIEIITGGKRPKFTLPPQIDEALKRKKPLLIKYVSAAGEETMRVIEPIEIIPNRDYLYLVAQCRLRKESRTFRLDRIVEMSVIKEEEIIDLDGR